MSGVIKVKVMAVSRKREGFTGILTNSAVYGERWASGKNTPEIERIEKGQLLNVKFTEAGDNNQYLNYELAEPIEAEDTTLESPKESIEESIDRRHGDRQSGAELGNARTNATNIVLAMYEKGDVKKEQIKTILNDLVKHILTIGG